MPTKTEYSLLLANITNQVITFNKVYNAEVSVIVSPSEVSLKNKGEIMETDEINLL